MKELISVKPNSVWKALTKFAIIMPWDMSCLIGLVRERVSWEVIFELSPEGGEWGHHSESWGQSTSGIRTKTKPCEGQSLGSWKERRGMVLPKPSE